MGSPFSGEIFREYPSQCSDCRWSSWQDTLSLFFAGIEDPGSGHAFPAARLVGGCVAPVLSLPLIIESRASWSVKYKFEDIINT